MKRNDLKKRDKILGCMVGGAVGDALGYAVEFDDYASIIRRYGEPGITKYELGPNGKALISDDTQMSLFTAAGCLLGHTRGCDRGIMGEMDCYCHQTYLDWYFTQTHSFGDKPEDRRFGSWLMRIPQLYHRRAPGNTCMNALRDLKNGIPHSNDSCGCGGVMRVAPVALLCEGFGEHYKYHLDAALCACLTHQHPLGYLPAAVLALIIGDILHNVYSNRAGLKKAVEYALETYPNAFIKENEGNTHREPLSKYIDKLSTLIRKAVSLVDEDIADVDAISQLGQGWTGHEALAIAVYCAMKHADSFDAAIISSVNHSGDSDSTGAICGNIAGALLGREVISPYWTNNLELLDVIEDIANDLYTGCPLDESGPHDFVDEWRWIMKYGDRHYWEPREQMEKHILDGSLFDKLGYNKKVCMNGLSK